MEQGYIKSYRKILDNHFLMQDNNAYMVFSKLLLLVSKSKGEWAGGRRQLGELVNLNNRTLYDVLLRLESQQIINITSNRKYSIISICNWSIYQSTPQPPTQPEPNHSPTTAQHSNKNKKENITNKAQPYVVSLAPELEPELQAFIEMRKAMRKPTTPTALQLVVTKLRKMYPDDIESQKACINQSIESSWQTVYELKHTTTAATRKYA